MRALAEYVMKGRTQAALVVVLATGTKLFVWVAAAVIALVILRKGLAQGGYLLLWGLLPATVLAAWGDVIPITTLLGAALVANVLRATSSWSGALAAAVVAGLLTAIMLMTVGAGYLDVVVQVLDDVFVELARQSAEVAKDTVPTDGATVSLPDVGLAPTNALSELTPSSAQVAGMLGLSNAFTVALCLILARWWQAALYNPGGFRQEFHRLRLSSLTSTVLLSAAVALGLMGQEYRYCAMIFAMPFVFSGFALVHGLIAKRNVGGRWLGLIYFGWLLLDPIKALLLILAVADSWVDIRSLVASKSSDNGRDG